MDTYRLRNGTDVKIRPIRPDDGQRLQIAYDSLSKESKYRRFLAAKPHLTRADTEYLVNVDDINHVALVAIAGEIRERARGYLCEIEIELPGSDDEVALPGTDDEVAPPGSDNEIELAA